MNGKQNGSVVLELQLTQLNEILPEMINSQMKDYTQKKQDFCLFLISLEQSQTNK